MKVTDAFINITSDNPERLLEFYRDTVGLPPRPEMGGFALHLASVTLAFDGHSETHGPAKEPTRVLLDMFVDDLAAEQKALEAKGVKFSRTAGREEWGGIISTFNDPDGNIVQLIEFKPE